MIRIVVQSDIADQIRQSDGQVELVDSQGQPLGMVRRPPTQSEIDFAKSRMGTDGPKVTMKQVISRVESL